MVDSLRAFRRGAFLYRRSLGAVIRSVLEYGPTSGSSSSRASYAVARLVFIGVVMARVPQINGWSFPEMVFIYGLAGVSSAIVPVAADGIWGLAGLHPQWTARLHAHPAVPADAPGDERWVGFNGVGDLIASTRC